MMTNISLKEKAKQVFSIRKDGLGGSDIAGICGLSKYKTPLQIYLEKKHAFANVPKLTTTIQIGIHSEKYIINVFKEKLEAILNDNINLQITPSKKYHHSYNFLYANVDALSNSNNKFICEAKFTSSKKWQSIPIEYICQIYHYLNIYQYDNIDIVYLPVWFSATSSSEAKKTSLALKIQSFEEYKEEILELLRKQLVIYKIQKDENLQKILENKSCEFWWYIKNNKYPNSKEKYLTLDINIFQEMVDDLIKKEKIIIFYES